jgi:3-oxoacyl-[acyl-carrier protein] reductase
MKRLEGRIAVITGVSDQHGIGAAVCRQFAKEGAHIFYTYYNAKSGWENTFSNEIKQNNVQCIDSEIDLSDSNSPNYLLDEVIRTLGVPTILVNNAAHSTNEGYRELDAKCLDSHYVVNIRGTCLLSVEFARRFENSKHKSGRIINMTSGQAKGAMPNELAYVATKGAISSFTLSLSAGVAPLGITVNAVNPGPTASGWMSEEIKKHLEPHFNMGRVGEPEDAARIILFLASDEAEWITGQVIHSEGGFMGR